jgi:hypothetical protein
MDAKILSQFVQIPYSHYKQLETTLYNLVRASETLIRATETPECYTRTRVFTEVLPACKDAIECAQAEAAKGK